MLFHILKVILWPRRPDQLPRIVTFEPGMVNVISGASQTGKSAIIPIIDYCLGSGKCAIPVRTIRDSCSWFGVVVQTHQGQKLFARREPGSQRTTDDMYMLESDFIVVPDSIASKNARRSDVKRVLNDIAGLTRLNFDTDETGAGFRDPPSFRDMQAFTIQPQNVVANPNVLFFKADTFEHREKLRTIFPYVLNAVTAEALALRHELSQLSKELRRKQNELKSLRQVSESWMAQLRSRVVEARALGLIHHPIPDVTTRQELFDILRTAIETPINEAITTEESLSEAAAELAQLRGEENEVSRNLVMLRRRYSQMTELRSASVAYMGALQVQRERLHVSRWLSTATESQSDCPVCGHELHDDASVRGLINALVAIEQTASELDRVPPAFDREHEHVRSELRVTTARLSAVKSRIEALEKRSSEVESLQFNSMGVARFIGAASQALEVFSAIGEDSLLAADVAELELRISALRSAIEESAVRARLQRALERIRLIASRILPTLDTEFPDSPVELVIEDLTVRVIGPDRADYLWELGSGANWLAYHIAISIALQEYFLSLPNSPVPSFLIYDQPSQVYFPHKEVLREGDDLDPKYNDEDLVAVRKVFQALADVVTRTEGRLQVIVLDHADEKVWGGIPQVHPVDEWRHGSKLVPLDWPLDTIGH